MATPRMQDYLQILCIAYLKNFLLSSIPDGDLMFANLSQMLNDIEFNQK